MQKKMGPDVKEETGTGGNRWTYRNVGHGERVGQRRKLYIMENVGQEGQYECDRREKVGRKDN